MIKIITIMLVTLITITGCTDAEMGKLSSYGGSARIECYSGTLKIYDGKSTGKVSSAEQSDGYYFVDKADNKLKEISGNCVITYESY